MPSAVLSSLSTFLALSHSTTLQFFLIIAWSLPFGSSVLCEALIYRCEVSCCQQLLRCTHWQLCRAIFQVSSALPVSFEFIVCKSDSWAHPAAYSFTSGASERLIYFPEPWKTSVCLAPACEYSCLFPFQMLGWWFSSEHWYNDSLHFLCLAVMSYTFEEYYTFFYSLQNIRHIHASSSQARSFRLFLVLIDLIKKVVNLTL